MATHIVKYVKPYATYSDLFGQPFDKDELKRLLYTLPWGAILNVAAQMLARPVGSNYIRKAFLKSLDAIGIDRASIEFIDRKYENRVLVYLNWNPLDGHPKRVRREGSPLLRGM
jgi:hypothetical protein